MIEVVDMEIPKRKGQWANKPGPNKQRTERMERALVAYVCDDMTLEQIGKRFGVTREMIRLDLNKIDKTLYRLALRRRKARQNLRSFVNRGSFMFTMQCHVCGEDFEADNEFRRYCSPIHYQVAMMMRYQISDEYRDMARISNAKSNIKSGRKSQLAFAVNYLDGTSKEIGRWIIPGSLSFHWAIRAYILGWPLFDKLSEPIQEQIREHVGSSDRWKVGL